MPEHEVAMRTPEVDDTAAEQRLAIDAVLRAKAQVAEFYAGLDDKTTVEIAGLYVAAYRKRRDMLGQLDTSVAQQTSATALVGDLESALAWRIDGPDGHKYVTELTRFLDERDGAGVNE